MGRVYVWRLRCPRCGRPYAKRTLWVRHVRSCAEPYHARWLRVNGVWKPEEASA